MLSARLEQHLQQLRRALEQVTPVEREAFLQQLLADTESQRLGQMLSERIKEKECLINISTALALPGSFAERLQACIDLIPSGWQYPHHTCARLHLPERRLTLISPTFQASPWSQRAPIPLAEHPDAQLEVFYQKHSTDSPFLPEEEALLQAIALQISLFIERKLAEEKLQLAASVFTHAREGILITDAAARIVDVNATFSRMTGYSREEVLGQNPRFLQSGRQGHEFYDLMWQTLLNTGHWQGEVWNRRKNGELFVQMLTISAVRDRSGALTHYVGLCNDITLMKQHQHHLEQIAHYDALTQLPNRVLLADRLEQAIRQCRRDGRTVAVVFLDLDGFKAVNDRHGHAAGDSLLVSLAESMQHALREGDTLARLGGDEFIALLPNLQQPDDCVPIMERLLDHIRRTMTESSDALSVTASLGVSCFPQHAQEADALLRQADQAMYSAKQGGKNTWCFYQSGKM